MVSVADGVPKEAVAGSVAGVEVVVDVVVLESVALWTLVIVPVAPVPGVGADPKVNAGVPPETLEAGGVEAAPALLSSSLFAPPNVKAGLPSVGAVVVVVVVTVVVLVPPPPVVAVLSPFDCWDAVAVVSSSSSSAAKAMASCAQSGTPGLRAAAAFFLSKLLRPDGLAATNALLLLLSS